MRVHVRIKSSSGGGKKGLFSPVLGSNSWSVSMIGDRPATFGGGTRPGLVESVLHTHTHTHTIHAHTSFTQRYDSSKVLSGENCHPYLCADEESM